MEISEMTPLGQHDFWNQRARVCINQAVSIAKLWENPPINLSVANAVRALILQAAECKVNAVAAISRYVSSK